MKKFFPLILSLIILISTAAAAFAAETKGTITVGINAEYAPFEYYDENGELTGFDIDLMNYIGKKINYNINYVEFPFERLLPAVASGEVDCAISAITITKERDGVVDYTRPYLKAEVAYKDGEKTIEQYAVVFSENSVNKARLTEASGDPFHSKYMLVDAAIKELIDDSTIGKLVEKYELEKGNFSESANYKFYVSESADEKETVDKTIPRYETWEEAGLTNPHIDFAHTIGITEKADYQLSSPVTREEFCEMIYNLILAVKKEISATHPQNFTDTTNRKMLVLSGLGIINGKSNTGLAPHDFLTREEAATIIMRMINKFIPMPATEMWFEYDDIAEISEWASDAVQTISNLGFMNGVGNNRFAPKDTYTTEQAITTLVRIYKAAESAGMIDKNTSIGIIGGADGPTSILVGDNVNVITNEDYEKFYNEIKTETAKIDDFYIDEAVKLVTESGKLAADKEFIGYYTSDDEILSKLSDVGAADYSKPSQIYCIEADSEQIIANLKAMYGKDAEKLNIEKLLKLNKVSFAMLPSLINASYGTKNLAAFTMLTNSRGYIMPKDFKNNFALYLEYDACCSALVTFSKFGDGVISANMSFVINGDKDNIFRRIYEITQGLGEDTIKLTKIK